MLRAGSQMDQARLLKHAIKVETTHLRSRKLEGDQQEGQDEGQNEGQQDNNNNENNNENENQNQNENQNDKDQNQEQNNEQNQDQDQEQNNDQEQENEQQQENQNEDEQNQDNDGDQEQNQEENDEEGNQEQNEDAQEANDDAAQVDDQVEQDAQEEEGGEFQINFLKCVALTIEPNVMDVEGMLANGEIDEDEAAELKTKYITEMTSSLNTQESVVFFTKGNNDDDDDDEDREVFMVGINDWIASSSGYDQTCNAIDEDDVDTIFSKIPSVMNSQVGEYSDHVWYSGFNCKADGSGFKPQLFLDETCTTFSPSMNHYYPFRKATETYSTEVASDQTKYMIEGANNSIYNSQNCNESNFCDNVLEKSVELATCEEADGRRRHLASYQLDYDMAGNIGDACPSIQTAFSIDQEYEFSAEDLESLVKYWSNTGNGGQESDRRSLIPGTNDIWIFLVGIIAFLCIASSLFVSRNKSPSRRLSKNSNLDTDDDTVESKKVPLVIKRVQPLGVDASESDLNHSMSAIECTLSKKKRKDMSELGREPRNREPRKTNTHKFRSFLKNSLSNTSSTSKGLSVD